MNRALALVAVLVSGCAAITEEVPAPAGVILCPAQDVPLPPRWLTPENALDLRDYPEPFYANEALYRKYATTITRYNASRGECGEEDR